MNKSMEAWLVYALLSMFFAGLTAILAKYGLEKVDADLALGIRTSIIFVLVLGFVLYTGKLQEVSSLNKKEVVLLITSGLATTLSWVFYFRALKEGPVSYVSVIDKGSIVVTLVLAFILLKEPMSWRVVLAGVLILAGMLVLVFK